MARADQVPIARCSNVDCVISAVVVWPLAARICVVGPVLLENPAVLTIEIMKWRLGNAIREPALWRRRVRPLHNYVRLLDGRRELCCTLRVT